MGEISLMREFMYGAAVALPNVRLFRRNVAKIKVEDRMIATGITGQCDLYAIVRGGRHIEIELKSKFGKLSEEQIRWCLWCRSWDVTWVALRQLPKETPAQTVSRWIKELRSIAC
jgi:hypothetical protein